MRGFSALMLVLLALLATTHAYMDPLDQGEDENDDRELDEVDPLVPRQMGERCGTDAPCEKGLDCVRFPIRRKCFPVKCGVEAIKQTVAETGFDLNGYGQKIMNEAGVTKDSSMFRPFPDAGLNLFDTDSEDMKKMEMAFMNDRAPVELFAAAYKNCTAASGSKATVAGLTPYFGASWELGALGTYNGDIFWGQGTNDTVAVGLLNNCFGIVLGYDAGISGLIGLGFTGRMSDLSAGCKQMFPIADFPPFGLQIGFIATEVPTFLMEFTGGASASAGLPGFTSCTTTVLS